MGYCAARSPPFDRHSRDRAGGHDLRPNRRGSTHPMTLLLAAVGATVTALLELTVGPYLRIGTAEPHLVLVLGIVVTVAIGLEAGWSGPSSGASYSMSSRQRPLGSTSFALLLCVGATSVLGRLLRPAPTGRADHRDLLSQPGLLDDPFHRLERSRRADPGVTIRSRSSCRVRSTTRSSRRSSGRWSSRSMIDAPTRNGWTGDVLPRRSPEAHQIPVAVPHLRSDRHPRGQRLDCAACSTSRSSTAADWRPWPPRTGPRSRRSPRRAA